MAFKNCFIQLNYIFIYFFIVVDFHVLYQKILFLIDYFTFIALIILLRLNRFLFF